MVKTFCVLYTASIKVILSGVKRLDVMRMGNNGHC